MVEQFYVTKKQFDWIVKHNGEEFGLTEECEDAVQTATVMARDVIAAGGEAEVLLANIFGKWDTVPLS